MAHAPALSVATAVLAVIAAIGTVVSSRTTSDILIAKNDAILARSDASDAYTAYEAHRVREQIYAAALAAAPRDAQARERLNAVIDTERREAAPELARAKARERAAAELGSKSADLTHAHDLVDIALALVEIAVAIISISALASSWLLAGFAGACALAGIAVGIAGVLTRP